VAAGRKDYRSGKTGEVRTEVRRQKITQASSERRPSIGLAHEECQWEVQVFYIATLSHSDFAAARG